MYNVNDPNEEILGYFAATSGDTLRVDLRRDDLDFFFEPNCTVQGLYSTGGLDRRSPCWECLFNLGDNVSLERPPYWD